MMAGGSANAQQPDLGYIKTKTTEEERYVQDQDR